MPKRKKVVRRVRPQVKWVTLILFLLFLFYLLWVYVSPFVVKKKVVADKTSIQLKYERVYKDSKNSNQDKIKFKSLAKLFTSQFFTLRGKTRKGEIGGLEYVSSENKDAFREFSIQNYYKYFDLLKEKYGDSLPEVENVEIQSIRMVDKIPYTSRVNYNPNLSPNDTYVVNVKIFYDNKTKDVKKYHTQADIYMKKIKGEIKVIKLDSE